ncbi:ABC transporter ATP-binding protein [Emergencia sp. 1XD21-10]|uniref:ABC transporter ATP-binding protein n=1 Tax=Emergencia sp. 1XD21-10 TaxID=2304569 RepID=UPI00137B82A8|nr:oligopeptide/dipeptide ABC transporter ATP-binding protein [Emergencia sp. 1XD21-10]NCE98678.1 ATP-binding cassette domain-containing protein [Emergencia sp. 1XD21-10]
MSDKTPLIEAIDIKKYFPVKKHMLHAVDGLSFQIEKGKTLGVVGESGCGKSTLGKTMIRLIEPTGGKMLFKGEDVFSMKAKEMREIRKKINIIFQDPYASLDPRMSVAESIMEPLLLTKLYPNKREAEKRVKELMDIVGLSDRVRQSYPHELDGGRRQRVGIARTLSVNPEFVVCDEPVSALDVSIQAQILNLLMDLQDELGLTYMFITHDLSVVRHISDDIIVMYRGVCVEQASSDELFANPLHPYTKALLAAIPDPSVAGIGKEPMILKGEVSSPIDPGIGCRFAGRCEYCSEACLAQDIVMTEVTPGHKVACCMHY